VRRHASQRLRVGDRHPPAFSDVNCGTLLQIAAGEIEVVAEHQPVAPTLVRSQVLSALYEAARRGEISATEGLERVTRINALKTDRACVRVLKPWELEAVAANLPERWRAKHADG
jgi:hypothetical protein